MLREGAINLRWVYRILGVCVHLFIIFGGELHNFIKNIFGFKRFLNQRTLIYGELNKEIYQCLVLTGHTGKKKDTVCLTYFCILKYINYFLFLHWKKDAILSFLFLIFTEASLLLLFFFYFIQKQVYSFFSASTFYRSKSTISFLFLLFAEAILLFIFRFYFLQNQVYTFFSASTFYRSKSILSFLILLFTEASLLFLFCF